MRGWNYANDTLANSLFLFPESTLNGLFNTSLKDNSHAKNIQPQLCLKSYHLSLRKETKELWLEPSRMKPILCSSSTLRNSVPSRTCPLWAISITSLLLCFIQIAVLPLLLVFLETRERMVHGHYCLTDDKAQEYWFSDSAMVPLSRE